MGNAVDVWTVSVCRVGSVCLCFLQKRYNVWQTLLTHALNSLIMGFADPSTVQAMAQALLQPYQYYLSWFSSVDFNHKVSKTSQKSASLVPSILSVKIVYVWIFCARSRWWTEHGRWNKQQLCAWSMYYRTLSICHRRRLAIIIRIDNYCSVTVSRGSKVLWSLLLQ